MAIRTRYTKEERILLDNIDRAQAAGVNIGGECQALHAAILSNATATGNIPVTDERVSNANDRLFDRAVEQGKQNEIKWVAQVK